jgi:hypothetical protein
MPQTSSIVPPEARPKPTVQAAIGQHHFVVPVVRPVPRRIQVTDSRVW